MSRPDDEEVELRSARERAEADDLAGAKARVAIEAAAEAHPLADLAAERERKPFLSEVELTIQPAPASQRVEHAEAVLPELRKAGVAEAKVVIVPQVDRSRFQTDLSQRKQRELGLSESRTAGGRTARLLVEPHALGEGRLQQALAEGDALAETAIGAFGPSNTVDFEAGLATAPSSRESARSPTVVVSEVPKVDPASKPLSWLIPVAVALAIASVGYFAVTWGSAKQTGSASSTDTARTREALGTASRPGPAAAAPDIVAPETTGSLDPTKPVPTPSEAASSPRLDPSSTGATAAHPRPAPSDRVAPGLSSASAGAPLHSATVPTTSVAAPPLPASAKPASSSDNPNIF